MAVRLILSFLFVLISSACTVIKTEPVSKIALLAPFEGQYREIGYNALYATRLALSETSARNIDLLAIDDGGTSELARQRIEALNHDPDVVAILALGQFSTSPEAQSALNNTPMLIIGYWGYSTYHENSYIFASSNIEELISDVEDEVNRIVGGELFSLAQTPLTENTDDLLIYSSATLPDANFRENYLASDEFAPEPSLFSTLTYDATNIILESIQTDTPISDIEYEGINGFIRFEDNYWLDAPLHQYRFEGLELVETFD